MPEPIALGRPLMPEGITWSVLLVDDDKDHASHVAAMLTRPSVRHYEIQTASDVSAALEVTRIAPPDAILLSVSQSHAEMTASIQALRIGLGGGLLIALTEATDDSQGESFIAAGAHDYLLRSELTEQSLRRAIGYAIARKREGQLRALRHSFSLLRRISSDDGAGGGLRQARSLGPLRERDPELFRDLAKRYETVLLAYLDAAQGSVSRKPLRSAIQRLVARIGDIGGGGRDLMDLHLATLSALEGSDRALAGGTVVFDSRVFAFEAMAMLVEYWRLGPATAGADP